VAMHFFAVSLRRRRIDADGRTPSDAGGGPRADRPRDRPTTRTRVEACGGTCHPSSPCV
jgi:hypothetical protein